MDDDHADIRQFLAAHPPFDVLPAGVLEDVAKQVRIVTADHGTPVLKARQHIRHLYIVRAGSIEIRGVTGEVWAQRLEGETFGLRALLSDGRAMFEATALEDSIVYLLPDAAFARLKLNFPEFNRFFTPVGGAGQKLARANDRLTSDGQSNLIALRIRDLMTPDPVTIEAEEPVQKAAQLMRTHDISCLPVTAGGNLAGIITTVDLRDRVAADGVPPDTPVAKVMTPEPLTLNAQSLAYDALLNMRRRTVRHLPVTEAGQLVGVVTSTDIVRRQVDDPGYFISNILAREAPASIAEVVTQIPYLLVVLVETGVAAYKTGLTITSITDVTTYRLLQLAEERLGAPPVPYVWLSAGSQARQEQSGLSDQDNCIILDDSYQDKAHGAYFDELSRYVCDGLHACGYVYCPGEMMAMTQKWRQPLAKWQRYFTSWIEKPEPEAQMLASTMFDLRPIRGETGLIDKLQAVTFEKAKANSLFVAHIVSNALTHTPPLGFLGKFVTARGGEHGHQIDLKMQGVVPIIDLARVYALKAGEPLANTRDRLITAHQASIISESGMHDLIDALEFLSSLRLKAQSRSIKAGQPPANFLAPDDLSRIERQHLRDAFLIVRTMQSNLANIYQIRR